MQYLFRSSEFLETSPREHLGLTLTNYYLSYVFTACGTFSAAFFMDISCVSQVCAFPGIKNQRDPVCHFGNWTLRDIFL